MTMRTDLNQLVEDICGLIDKIKSHAIRALIKESVLESFKSHLKSKSPKYLNFAWRHLSSIVRNEWAEMERIYTLPHINPEMWDNYKWMFGKKPVLPEQKQMKAAEARFRKRWLSFRQGLQQLDVDTKAQKARTEE